MKQAESLEIALWCFDNAIGQFPRYDATLTDRYLPATISMVENGTEGL